MNSLNPLWRSSTGTKNKSAIGSYCPAAKGTINYRHSAPLGLKRWGHRVAIDIPPRWSCVSCFGDVFFASRHNATKARILDRFSIQSSPHS